MEDLKFLREHHIGREDHPTRRNYSDEELNVLREELMQLYFKLDDEENAFLMVKKDYKDKADELRERINLRKKEIRLRFSDIEVDCFLLPDFEKGTMQFFDVNTGQLVDERRLRPDERQPTLLMSNVM